MRIITIEHFEQGVFLQRNPQKECEGWWVVPSISYDVSLKNYLILFVKRMNQSKCIKTKSPKQGSKLGYFCSKA